MRLKFLFLLILYCAICRTVKEEETFDLNTVFKDPRVVGSGTAILWLIFDDVPEPRYRTFSDPGAAAMQSIILGEFVALAVFRRWDRTSKIWLVAAVIFKVMFQMAFYVKDALVIDLGTLLVAHLFVAILATKEHRFISGVLRCGGAVASCGLAFAFCAFINSHFDHGGFWSLAVSRAVFSYLFWSSMLLLSDRVSNQRG